jgi:hypothetical protein
VNLSNAWLSGFSDAEGCLTASVIKRSEKYTQVQVRYIVSQKWEEKLMSEIAKLFDGKISYLKSYEGSNMTVNLCKLKKVINYFKKYPLKIKKHIDYLNWLKVFSLVSDRSTLLKLV